jgi:hypothetical protein
MDLLDYCLLLLINLTLANVCVYSEQGIEVFGRVKQFRHQKV